MYIFVLKRGRICSSLKVARRRFCGIRALACSKSRTCHQRLSKHPLKLFLVVCNRCSMFSAWDVSMMDTRIPSRERDASVFVFTVVSDTCTFVVLLGCQSMVCGQ